MGTYGTAHINSYRICKLSWQWTAPYPSDFYRPESLLTSALSLEIPSADGFASRSVVYNAATQAGSAC